MLVTPKGTLARGDGTPARALVVGVSPSDAPELLFWAEAIVAGSLTYVAFTGIRAERASPNPRA